MARANRLEQAAAPQSVPEPEAVPQVRPLFKGRGFWRRFFSQPAALVGTVILGAFFLVALGANFIAPGDPFTNSGEILLPPSASHLFGTDDLGREMFRAVIHGTRVSLLIGFLTAVIASTVGIVIGSLSGFVGGWVDDILMRLTELFMVVPRFFLALLVVALLGSHIGLIIVLLGLTFWPGTARLLRGQVLTIKTRDYILAARAVGVPERNILIRHILPASMPPVVTEAAFLIGGAILVEAGLSFLGLGDRNVVSWGTLLNNAQQFVRAAWWMSAFPGLAITLIVLALNLVADGLNQALNPRLNSGKHR
ncbi:MAG: dppC 2 [Chloroflexi bacterium]|jgi:peptide/nickel transport system permease protein|nr:dppC 2 [Chloroflexota bacterium]